MRTRNPKLGEVHDRAQETAQKAQALLREAHSLHDAVDAVHKKAERLHSTIRERREKTGTERNLKTPKK